MTVPAPRRRYPARAIRALCLCRRPPRRSHANCTRCSPTGMFPVHTSSPATRSGVSSISDFTARYPSEVAGLVFIDGIAPGSVRVWLADSNAPPEPWDGSADVALLENLTFGSRPVVVLTTAQPGEIPAFRRSATNILVARPHDLHTLSSVTHLVCLRGAPSRDSGLAQRWDPPCLRADDPSAHRRLLLSYGERCISPEA